MEAHDIDAYLSAVEAEVPGITEGAEKRIIWAGEKDVQTPLVVVYIHGFSGTSEEIRPVPDLVAKGLGANLFFTRLQGHGLTGAALAEATLAGWKSDMDEVISVGRALGERIILITCSTGGTLATLAAAKPKTAAALAGISFVSPNFALKHPLAFLLGWPGARHWVPWVIGRQATFPARNAANEKFWTLEYPTRAIFPMVEAVAEARKIDPGSIHVPAQFLFSDDDQVVDPRRTRKVATKWGGPVEVSPKRPGATDDENCHVIAGDILSPGMTAQVAEEILTWARGL